MKIKLNGKDCNIPHSWDDVTFGESLEMIRIKEKTGKCDHADVLSIYLKMSDETLRKATITNLNEVLQVISFMDNTPMPLNVIPKSINGYLIPLDLNFRSICRFEDLKSYAAKCIPAEKEELQAKHLENYYRMVGVYAQPDYENSTPQDRELFAKQFLNAPCGEVMAIGNFTLMKLTGLSVNVSRTFLKAATLMRKLKLVLSGYSARLVSSVRFFIWKKRHLTKETNSFFGQ